MRLKSIPELQEALRGRWHEVFSSLAPELGDAAEVAGKKGHVPCPVHGGTDGFRLFRDYATTGGGVCNTCGPFNDGFALLGWLRGGDVRSVLKDVGAWERGRRVEPTPVKVKPAPAPPPPDPAKALAACKRVLLPSVALPGTAAEKYLLNRGIPQSSHSAALRFNQRVRYFEAKAKHSHGDFPCLVAPIRNAAGRVVSLHRIYLTENGQKAAVPEVKKMMTPCGEVTGGAVRLFTPGAVLGVAEGIETALAVHAGTKGSLPVWSCVNTALLKGLKVPEEVQVVLIWADKDRPPEKRPDLPPPGKAAAEALAKRLREEGKEVHILYPDMPIPVGNKGVDWLDVFKLQGGHVISEAYQQVCLTHQETGGKVLSAPVKASAEA